MIKMDIVQLLTTPEIKELEERIAELNNARLRCYDCVNSREFNENIIKADSYVLKLQHLIKRRKKLINGKLLKYQSELLPDIIEFNDALKWAFRNLWDMTETIYCEINIECQEIEASLWFDEYLPEKHPLAGQPSWPTRYPPDIWAAIMDPNVHAEYRYGVHQSIVIPGSFADSFDRFIGLGKSTPNWNEGLDWELTKGLHLIMPFHTLFEHTCFALSDLIYIRDFRYDVHVEMLEQPYHYDKRKKKMKWPVPV